jgi:hypothetical protein
MQKHVHFDTQICQSCVLSPSALPIVLDINNVAMAAVHFNVHFLPSCVTHKILVLKYETNANFK